MKALSCEQAAQSNSLMVHPDRRNGAWQPGNASLGQHFCLSPSFSFCPSCPAGWHCTGRAWQPGRGWDTNLGCHSHLSQQQQVPPAGDAAEQARWGSGSCSVLGQGLQSLLGTARGLSPPWLPAVMGIYCMSSYSPFLVQRFGISSELRETTAAAGLARDSSRAALDLWGRETLRKAE